MIKTRLEKFYEDVVCEDFILLYGFKNISNLPCFERCVLSSTSSQFNSNSIVVVQSFGVWLLVSGQKCVKTRARKSIALFDIRKDNLLGVKVTCRKRMCFTLLDKLLICGLPRLVSPRISNSRPPVSSAFSTKKENEHLIDVERELHFQSSDCTAPHNLEKQMSSLERVAELRVDSKENQKIESDSKAFFTISHSSARFFPEVGGLEVFSDHLPGFSVSCSIRYKNKNQNKVDCSTLSVKEKLSFVHKGTPKTLQYNDVKGKESVSSSGAERRGDHCSVKKQFISAFQYPSSTLSL